MLSLAAVQVRDTQVPVTSLARSEPGAEGAILSWIGGDVAPGVGVRAVVLAIGATHAGVASVTRRIDDDAHDRCYRGRPGQESDNNAAISHDSSGSQTGKRARGPLGNATQLIICSAVTIGAKKQPPQSDK